MATSEDILNELKIYLDRLEGKKPTFDGLAVIFAEILSAVHSGIL